MGFGFEIIGRQFGQTFNTFQLHGLCQRGHARFDRQAIGDDQALGTLSIGAKYALGAVIFGVMAEDLNAVGKKSGRDHFAFIAGQFLPVPGKWDDFSFGDIQDWMFGDAFQYHKLLPLNFKIVQLIIKPIEIIQILNSKH
jgi:hypothetical protein